MKNNSHEDLLEVPIRASLWKSVLLAGADRRVTIVIIGSCMVLVLLSRFALWPCITALLLATAGQIIGVKLAAIDPNLLDVYLRHINFKRIYCARPDITLQEAKPFPSVPKL
jgi:type IV secretory pathway TrbD component